MGAARRGVHDMVDEISDLLRVIPAKARPTIEYWYYLILEVLYRSAVFHHFPEFQSLLTLYIRQLSPVVMATTTDVRSDDEDGEKNG